MVNNITYSFFSFRKTCTDIETTFIEQNIYFYEVNFHISTFGALYGAAGNVNASAGVGTVISFKNGNLHDIQFKNAAAGSNAVIDCVATIVDEKVKKALGI